MFKITLEILPEEKIAEFADELLAYEDPTEAYEKLDRFMTPYQRNMHENDEDHRFDNTPYYMRDIKVVYEIYPKLFKVYCVLEARRNFYYDENKNLSAGQVINHYVTDRYNFIHEGESAAILEKDFEKYLASRGITEDEYFTEYLANCLMQEYSIIAQMLDTCEPFCNKSDILKYIRHQNYIEHTAREIVTESNVYALV